MTRAKVLRARYNGQRDDDPLWKAWRTEQRRLYKGGEQEKQGKNSPF